eukprot:gene14370-biopygen2331
MSQGQVLWRTDRGTPRPGWRTVGLADPGWRTLADWRTGGLAGSGWWTSADGCGGLPAGFWRTLADSGGLGMESASWQSSCYPKRLSQQSCESVSKSASCQFPCLPRPPH